MGCATSKQKKVCRSCQRPHSPVQRSYSMHVHHPPQKTGDSYHLVALTSSTLGSLKLDPLIHNHPIAGGKEFDGDDWNQKLKEDESVAGDNKPSAVEDGERERVSSVKEEFALGMIEAKTWSHMIDCKIPKIPPMTPVRTPPGEPETIDAWEMMAGLQDASPLCSAHLRSFSFHVAGNPASFPAADDRQTSRVKDAGAGNSDGRDSDTSSNLNSNDSSIVSEFDPDVIATFRRALEELPLGSTFLLRPIEEAENPSRFDKLIVYFTSLCGVRKTYEDCCHVRMIVKGLAVKVDERDVSMHSGFKEELKTALLAAEAGGIRLPSVFLGRKLVGGAEEIRRLNEEGMLGKLVENCEPANEGGVGAGAGKGGRMCKACGDVRFLPCETCSGSCKLYYDADFENERNNEDEDDEECGFKRCPDCNENGLIRCPICCG